MREHRVSSRYARALTTLALEQNIEDRVVEDKDYILAVMNLSRELRVMLASPVVSSFKKKQILKELFESKVSELMMHFLLLVEEKNREDIIRDIFEEFEKDYNIRHNKLPVKIFSAIELTEDVKTKTVKRMAEITGKTIIPEFIIDESIIGGITILYNDLFIDASVKSQLEKLHSSLKAA